MVNTNQDRINQLSGTGPNDSAWEELIEKALKAGTWYNPWIEENEAYQDWLKRPYELHE